MKSFYVNGGRSDFSTSCEFKGGVCVDTFHADKLNLKINKYKKHSDGVVFFQMTLYFIDTKNLATLSCSEISVSVAPQSKPNMPDVLYPAVNYLYDQIADKKGIIYIENTRAVVNYILRLYFDSLYENTTLIDEVIGLWDKGVEAGISVQLKRNKVHLDALLKGDS